MLQGQARGGQARAAGPVASCRGPHPRPGLLAAAVQEWPHQVAHGPHWQGLHRPSLWMQPLLLLLLLNLLPSRLMTACALQRCVAWIDIHSLACKLAKGPGPPALPCHILGALAHCLALHALSSPSCACLQWCEREVLLSGIFPFSHSPPNDSQSKGDVQDYCALLARFTDDLSKLPQPVRPSLLLTLLPVSLLACQASQLHPVLQVIIQLHALPWALA